MVLFICLNMLLGSLSTLLKCVCVCVCVCVYIYIYIYKCSFYWSISYHILINLASDISSQSSYNNLSNGRFSYRSSSIVMFRQVDLLESTEVMLRNSCFCQMSDSVQQFFWDSSKITQIARQNLLESRPHGVNNVTKNLPLTDTEPIIGLECKITFRYLPNNWSYFIQNRCDCLHTYTIMKMCCLEFTNSSCECDVLQHLALLAEHLQKNCLNCECLFHPKWSEHQSCFYSTDEQQVIPHM